MCKIRVLHFSTHDVRVRMATDPFSEPGGPSDFIAPTAAIECRCVDSLVLDTEAEYHLSRFGFERCHWHQCCVISHLTVSCRLFRDHPDRMHPRDAASQPQCANTFVVKEYHPISTVLRDPLSPAWKPWEANDGPPYFPATELFYSATITDAPVPDDESYGLYEDRSWVEYFGIELAREKMTLMVDIEFATLSVETLERDLKFNDPVEVARCIAMHPEVYLNEVRKAHKFVDMVERSESALAGIYQRMMQRTGYVLTMLGRMPDPGQSVTVADGLFSVSQEQLDLGGLDYQDVVDACDGPLKVSGELRRRLENATTILQSAENDVGSRSTPVPTSGM
ncbi:hypothetical protein B0I37DRAFT_431105 [Chaetomium sp. MPI-CAGE-AT-0009]|nr:hypothetical protein B0I37DRAFT_431105 [Chaetomium sp. MPI-CAGE-AT-0009]